MCRLNLQPLAAKSNNFMQTANRFAVLPQKQKNFLQFCSFHCIFNEKYLTFEAIKSQLSL